MLENKIFFLCVSVRGGDSRGVQKTEKEGKNVTICLSWICDISGLETGFKESGSEEAV